MEIKQILTRVYVNHLDSAIHFYEELTHEKCISRFEYKQMNLEIARVKDILLIAGSHEALSPFRQTNATFLVDSVTEFREYLLKKGSTVIRDIQVVPTGWNMTVKHPDGLVVEYVEHTH